jgi:hypothetical protein
MWCAVDDVAGANVAGSMLIPVEVPVANKHCDGGYMPARRIELACILLGMQRVTCARSLCSPSLLVCSS